MFLRKAIAEKISATAETLNCTPQLQSSKYFQQWALLVLLAETAAFPDAQNWKGNGLCVDKEFLHPFHQPHVPMGRQLWLHGVVPTIFLPHKIVVLGVAQPLVKS